MEKPAVYDAIECASETAEVQCVGRQELDCDVSFFCLGLCLANGVRGSIDAPNLVTPVGKIEGVFPCAAAAVQD